MFEDESFDAYFPEFTQHLQAIPSPWGMAMYENIEFDNIKSLTSYLLHYPETDATFISTPDFTGRTVDKYIELRDLMSHLLSVERAFPTSSVAEDSEYFEQCPATFDQEALISFSERLRTQTCQEFSK